MIKSSNDKNLQMVKFQMVKFQMLKSENLKMIKMIKSSKVQMITSSND